MSTTDMTYICGCVENVSIGGLMKIILYCLLPLLVLAGCSVKPYLKNTDLPKGINYYSNDKQFTVHPDWFWKLRPSLERGSESVTFEYLKQLDPGYKNANVNVVGEVVYKQNKFYVALWQSHGYFFIQEKDYLFAQKYRKYLVPLDYDAGSYLYGYSNMTEFEKITLLEKYFGNLKGKKYKIYNALYLLQNSIFDKRSYITPQIKQYFSSNGYSNDFIEFNNCPLFYEFCKNDEALY